MRATATVAAADHRLRHPVARLDGARWVGLLAVAFGVTVVVTRLYLSLAGYPQIGGGEYHLAHALWGGLLLMVGGMLALLWSNRWVQPLTAVLVGAGSGLFVDEVGKFITARNDYFTPLAVPVIYVVFLGVLAVALLARTAPLHDPRTTAYSLVVGLKALADGPLLPATRTELLQLTTALEAADQLRPDLAELARRIRPVIEAAPVRTPGTATRTALAALAALERRFLPRWLVRVVIAGGSFALGVLSLLSLLVLLAVASGDPAAHVVIDDRSARTEIDPLALLLASAGEAVVGGLLLVAAVAMVLGIDRWGSRIGRFALVLGLAGVNVLLGYVSAELVVGLVVVELLLLLLFDRHRSRFLGSARPGRGVPEHAEG